MNFLFAKEREASGYGKKFGKNEIKIGKKQNENKINLCFWKMFKPKDKENFCQKKVSANLISFWNFKFNLFIFIKSYIKKCSLTWLQPYKSLSRIIANNWSQLISLESFKENYKFNRFN